MSDYFSRPEISNSDLTALQKELIPREQFGDIQAAYRFGTLLDALITEPHRVDLYKRTVDGNVYSREEIDLAERMKRSFMRDEFCRLMAGTAQMQKVSVVPKFRIEHQGVEFFMPARAKWDLFDGPGQIDGDIKSTTAETQRQFEEAIRYFGYHRQAAWYMNLENRDRFMIIGVSKKNLRVFKVPISRDLQIFKDGQQAYEELAFKFWLLFGDIDYGYREDHNTHRETIPVQQSEAWCF